MPAGQAVTITRTVPHGHVAAVHAMAAKLGLPALPGPACPDRDLALALIISRVVAPASKLAALTWWADTTLGADLGAAEVSTGHIYAAMDWLEDRQDAIEARLAAQHLAGPRCRGRSGGCGPGRQGAAGSGCSECPRDYPSITFSDEGGLRRTQSICAILWGLSPQSFMACIKPAVAQVFLRLPLGEL